MKQLTIVILLLPFFLSGQGWEKTYGGIEEELSYSVQQTTDGGYIISGNTNSFGNGSSDVYLIKTNEFGNIIWEKTYGGEYVDRGYSVQQTMDGGYIVAGKTDLSNNYQNYVYLIKTDANGDTLWTKAIGDEYSVVGKSVQQTTDGGYIITGHILYDYGYGDFDVNLIKTDENGNVSWLKTFGGNDWDMGRCVQQTQDGGYIVVGYTESYGNSNYGLGDVYLIKTDANGDTLWTKTYGGDFEDGGHSVQQTVDGGFIITGSHHPNGYGTSFVNLIRTDSNGDVIWTRTHHTDGSCSGSSVQQTSDGGFIIAGGAGIDYGTGYAKVLLVKTNSSGDASWTETFGGEYFDYGKNVQQTTDGGYIITGYTNSFGNGDYDIYLIKTDENGVVTFTTEIPIPDQNKKLIKTIDLSGREVLEPPKNQMYIEIYDNGSTEKKMIIK